MVRKTISKKSPLRNERGNLELRWQHRGSSVEYSTSPSCFTGGLIGSAVWGLINNQERAAYILITIGLLILTTNFYLMFAKKLRYSVAESSDSFPERKFEDVSDPIYGGNSMKISFSIPIWFDGTMMYVELLLTATDLFIGAVILTTITLIVAQLILS